MARKSGIFSGIIALLLAFVQRIPLYPPLNYEILFYLFTLNNFEYYFWGYLDQNNIVFSFLTQNFPENLISFLVWLSIFFVGVSSIMASTTKAKKSNSIKLYRINILFTLLQLFSFGIMIIMSIFENLGSIFTVLGIGYYFILLVLLLNLIALHYLKKE